MAPYKHSALLNAAEMAAMITSAARVLQSSDIHGMFGVIDEKAASWAKAYPQLTEAWQTYNAAFRSLGCTNDARQHALDELLVLAAAFSRLGDTPSPLCPNQTSWGGICAQAVINGQCSDPKSHA